MSSLSIQAYKLRVHIGSLLSRISAWNKEDSTLEQKDEKRLDAVLHYPLKTASIPLVSIDTLLNRQQEKIRIIERDIGLIYKGCEYNFVDLVESTIKAYLSYCHLIPASEMDHHQYVGGLLEHSLDVSIRSLQFSMSFMLDEMGLVDEDQARRPRYEFAAWVCGLLHDSGKIISNVQVIGSNGDVWRPLSENIYEWAKRNNIDSYTVVHQKDRLNNDHETNSVHFLPLVLNDVAKNYLLGSHDDLYSMITQTLVHYHSYKGYLFNAVRKADSESTYDDYARVWLHDSSRKKSLTMGVVNAMRSLYSNWSINKLGGDLFVFNGQIYIASDRPINDVIKKCLDYEIKLPTSAKALISILLDKRILSMVSDKSTHANLYLGEFTESDINQFAINKTGPMAKVSPVTVILVEWPNFVVGDNPLPANVHGALRYNTSKNNNVHQLCNGEGMFFVTPSDAKVVQDDSETKEEQPATTVDEQPTASVDESEKPVTKAPTKRKPKPKSKPKPKAKSKTSSTPEPIDDDIESNAEAVKTKPSTIPVNKKEQSNPSDEETQSQVSDDSIEATEEQKQPVPNESASQPNGEYPWITKPRRPKPVDNALSTLLTTPGDNLWLEADNVCLSLNYVMEQASQNAGQIINAMSYLKLLKKNEKGKEISIKVIAGEKTTYVLLSDDVANIFRPTLQSIPVDTATCETATQKQAEIVAAQESSLEVEPEQLELNTVEPEMKSSPVSDEKASDPDSSSETLTNKDATSADKASDPVEDVTDDSVINDDEYSNNVKTMSYEELINELKSVCPKMKNTELRGFTKAEGVKPIISADGSITVEITSIELDELKWKLRENNE
ncbi:MobH family relaxase [Shewanella algicola]|uniref:MobH family relaxase n=1 Tax=Shewanella algicola TaxID=640633 RepID=UPI00249586CA|nr:MobH family relaxase [Shewanella algicola]